ncbi:unnamed protein product [Vitrella brassicaformis CCMP3155]|uniref:Peptidase S1 domain-containing protein n=2 Tax=Vitrella brassicaformis TaxID=1169539 RepID=A0A0G4FIF0_VITBC|nr:unnamed protein product [Vitrella brassicaformis CCMP3155]|eukprot:CEM12887.1 unnamed protein product [Vitrella brassicaformis CCMP3155]
MIRGQVFEEGGSAIGFGLLAGPDILLTAAHVAPTAATVKLGQEKVRVDGCYVMPEYIRHGHPDVALLTLTTRVASFAGPIPIATHLRPRHLLMCDTTLHNRYFGGSVVKVHTVTIGGTTTEGGTTMPVWLQVQGTSPQEGDSGSDLALPCGKTAAVVHGLSPHRGQGRHASRPRREHPYPFLYACPLDCLRQPALFHRIPKDHLPLLSALETLPPTFFESRCEKMSIERWLQMVKYVPPADIDTSKLLSAPTTMRISTPPRRTRRSENARGSSETGDEQGNKPETGGGGWLCGFGAALRSSEPDLRTAVTDAFSEMNDRFGMLVTEVNDRFGMLATEINDRFDKQYELFAGFPDPERPPSVLHWEPFKTEAKKMLHVADAAFDNLRLGALLDRVAAVVQEGQALTQEQLSALNLTEAPSSSLGCIA